MATDQTTAKLEKPPQHMTMTERRHHAGAIWRTPHFYGVVDKMPLRAVITASCPADRLQEPCNLYFLSPSSQTIRSSLHLSQNQNTVLSPCVHAMQKTSGLAAVTLVDAAAEQTKSKQ